MYRQTFNDPVVWNRVIGFLVVNPCNGKVTFLLLGTVHHYFVDNQLVDCAKCVASVAFLFRWNDVVGFDL